MENQAETTDSLVAGAGGELALGASASRGSASHLARRLSAILSPPIVAAVTFWVLAGTFGGNNRLQVFVICALAQTILPVAYLLVAARRGWIGDVEMSDRVERRLGLPLLGLVYLVGGLLAVVAGLPAGILIVCLCSLVVLGGIWAINLVYKASGHVAGVTAYMTVLSLVVYPLHPGLALIPALSWARVRSGAHTPVQTLWGVVIGAGLTLALYASIYRPIVDL